MVHPCASSQEKDMTIPYEKALYSVHEIIELAGIGRRRRYQEMKRGRLKAVKIGKRTGVRKARLEGWLSKVEG